MSKIRLFCHNDISMDSFYLKGIHGYIQNELDKYGQVQASNKTDEHTPYVR